MVANIEFLRRYMASADFAPYVPVERTPGIHVTGDALREWIRRNWVPSVFHPGGTAAKTPRERGGVVDETCNSKVFWFRGTYANLGVVLVHGTEGLSIADASIMPLLPGCNLQSTVYAIAEKVF